MKPLRVLYLDVPFEGESGGDKNRSRFLWESLRETCDAQLALIQHNGNQAAPATIPATAPVIRLRAKPGPWWESDSVSAFGPDQRAGFDQVLTASRYDAVVARFHTPWELCRLAANHSSRPAVVMDLDMVSSRLVSLTWRQRPTFRNRWFLFEKWKLERLERRLLRQPWLVFLSNGAELADLRDRVAPRPARGRLAELPNIMPADEEIRGTDRTPAILFFGSLNSAANMDGFRFLMDELVPRLDADLRRQDVRIHVAGKNPPGWFADRLRQGRTDRVVLVGGVDSMARTIAESRFVLLPLRVASGTRTRILEAAAQGRAVITTPLGAEGIDVGRFARVHEQSDALAGAVRDLLTDPAGADRLGSQLRDRCRARYAPGRVAGELARELRAFVERHQARENLRS